MQPIASHLKAAVMAAVSAGAAIIDVYRCGFKVEQKDDRSPLTLADKKSHDIIETQLRETGLPILSEEGRDIPYGERKNWDVFWLVDPLDGTKEFIKRNGEFTVNIALIEKKRPVMGVIFVPARHSLYYAATGAGAYRLDLSTAPILTEIESQGRRAEQWVDLLRRRSERLPLCSEKQGGVTIIGSRSHGGADLEAFVEKMRQQNDRIDFKSAGSSLKFCRVAEGAADMYPRLGPTMEWDTAAGQAIAEGSGARVYDFNTGEPLGYNKKDLHNPWFVVDRKGI